MSLLENFCENLRARLEAEHLSQSELARRAHVRSSTVSDILCGKMEPSLSMCERLAIAAGLPADVAFLLPESPPKKR